MAWMDYCWVEFSVLVSVDHFVIILIISKACALEAAYAHLECCKSQFCFTPFTKIHILCDKYSAYNGIFTNTIKWRKEMNSWSLLPGFKLKVACNVPLPYIFFSFPYPNSYVSSCTMKTLNAYSSLVHIREKDIGNLEFFIIIKCIYAYVGALQFVFMPPPWNNSYLTLYITPPYLLQDLKLANTCNIFL